MASIANSSLLRSTATTNKTLYFENGATLEWTDTDRRKQVSVYRSVASGVPSLQVTQQADGFASTSWGGDAGGSHLESIAGGVAVWHDVNTFLGSRLDSEAQSDDTPLYKKMQDVLQAGKPVLDEAHAAETVRQKQIAHFNDMKLRVKTMYESGEQVPECYQDKWWQDLYEDIEGVAGAARVKFSNRDGIKRLVNVIVTVFTSQEDRNLSSRDICDIAISVAPA